MIGAEPAAADDAWRSFHTGTLHTSGNPRTTADGLRTSLGENTFPIVRAMRIVWERMKIVIEPSAAVPLAAILEGKLDIRGMRVAIVLSGGNVDLDSLPWLTRPRPTSPPSA